MTPPDDENRERNIKNIKNKRSIIKRQLDALLHTAPGHNDSERFDNLSSLAKQRFRYLQTFNKALHQQLQQLEDGAIQISSLHVRTQVSFFLASTTEKKHGLKQGQQKLIEHIHRDQQLHNIGKKIKTTKQAPISHKNKKPKH